MTPPAAPRWCPGCGNFAFLEQFRGALARGPRPSEVIAGVGCAGRVAHYVECDGLQTLPGRAFAVALGLALADPARAVWVVTGDADADSGAGLHHLARRNADVKVVILNNRVGGLARGGGRGEPPDLLAGAILGGATFAARAADSDAPLLNEVPRRAAGHSGTAVVEVLQNCATFHDDSWAAVTDRNLKRGGAVVLAAGEPLRFGADREHGVSFRGPLLAAGPASAGDWVHDEAADPLVGVALARLAAPLALGVIRAAPRPVFALGAS